MSYCVDIRTKKKIEPQSIFDALAVQNKEIEVVSDSFPTLRFGSIKYALRGVEVNEEDYGYEVRICSMASMADYQLFPFVVSVLKKLTGGEVYSEEDPDKPIKDPKKRFGLKWRRIQTEGSWKVTCALVKETGNKIIFHGLFAPFAVGPNMLQFFEVDLDNPTGGQDYKRLEYDLFQKQWLLKDLIPANNSLAIRDPENEEHLLSLSAIQVKDGEVSEFGYIPVADLFGFINSDTGEVVIIKFDDLLKVMTSDKFMLIDESQLVRTAEFSVNDFCEAMERAKEFRIKTDPK